MTAVKISGTFKKDERPDNGLEKISADLVKDEFAQHVVVGIVVPHGTKKDPGEAPVPTVRFLAIEPLDGDAATQARVLLDAARRGRGEGGAATLFDVDDPDLLEYAEEKAAQSEAEEAGPVEHEGATEGYADELAEMKADLGITPTTCQVCGREIHYDPARDGYVDAEGWTDGAEDGGHPHVPAERATVGSEAR